MKSRKIFKRATCRGDSKKGRYDRKAWRDVSVATNVFWGTLGPVSNVEHLVDDVSTMAGLWVSWVYKLTSAKSGKPLGAQLWNTFESHHHKCGIGAGGLEVNCKECEVWEEDSRQQSRESPRQRKKEQERWSQSLKQKGKRKPEEQVILAAPGGCLSMDVQQIGSKETDNLTPTSLTLTGQTATSCRGQLSAGRQWCRSAGRCDMSLSSFEHVCVLWAEFSSNG